MRQHITRRWFQGRKNLWMDKKDGEVIVHYSGYSQEGEKPFRRLIHTGQKFYKDVNLDSYIGNSGDPVHDTGNVGWEKEE